MLHGAAPFRGPERGRLDTQDHEGRVPAHPGHLLQGAHGPDRAVPRAEPGEAARYASAAQGVRAEAFEKLNVLLELGSYLYLYLLIGLQ